MLGPISDVMARRGLPALAVILATVMPRVAAGAQDAGALTTEELQQDIELLRVLTRAALQPDELRSLANAAAEVAQKRQGVEAARADPALKAALEQLREALLAGQPEQQVQAIEVQVEPASAKLHQAEEAMFATAETAVAGLLQVLPEAVLHDLLSAQMGDPVQALRGALHESRHIPPAEFDGWLQQVSRELSLGLAHGNADAAEASRAEIEKLLTSTRQMTNAQLAAAEQDLDAQVQAIAGAADQTQDPDRKAQMVREMLLGLLMNPRLDPVLQARLARG